MASHHTCFIEFNKNQSLQDQVRAYLVKCILNGSFPQDKALPSCRKLSTQLKVSRNTISIVYEKLLDEGYLISKPRSGYYLAPGYEELTPQEMSLENKPKASDSNNSTAQDTCSTIITPNNDENIHAPNWHKRLKLSTSAYPKIQKPSYWSHYKYPFIYGQPSIGEFPLTQWRESSRKVIADAKDHSWLCDKVDKDVDALIQQLKMRVLPQRGIHASEDEILITIGSQNALSLVSLLLMDQNTKVGIENPGYREAHNVFSLCGAQLMPHQVDSQGLVPNQTTTECDYFYVTPSHQAPTGVTMSDARRTALLELANTQDKIIIEDDYDSENNLEFFPKPALKAKDKEGRVIYVGSFSKILAPGLRLGYIVASEALIYELRNLRRLMYRHVPSRIQMEVAHFIAQGYYDSYLRRFRTHSRERLALMRDAMDAHLPDCHLLAKTELTNSLWLQTPNGMDSHFLASRAAQHGVLIETGHSHFYQAPESQPPIQMSVPKSYFRLGFHAIAPDNIEDGIKALAKAMG